MNMLISPKLLQIFRRVLQARRWIVAAFSILAVAGIYGATRIPTDPAIERLVVAGDPMAQATLDFERVFPEGDQALLMLEAPDPFNPDALQSADRLERELNKIPQVAAHSLLTLHRRSGSAETISPDDAAHMRAFATGTTLFRRAGLVGEHYLGLALELRVNSAADRDRALAAIDAHWRRSTRSCCPSRDPATHSAPSGASARRGSMHGLSGELAPPRRNSCLSSGFF